MARVLVVDDEARVRTFLSRSLGAQGHEVLEAEDGTAALTSLDRQSVDLVLLDLVMPRMGGLEVLAALQHRDASTPVIVVTGSDSVGTRIQALDRGAVDVVRKPFHTAELIARIRRHAGQRTVPPSEQHLVGGDVRLDLQRRRAKVGDREVSLSEREFGLLAHLMRRAGAVCGRDELLHDVWGIDFDPGSNVVDVYVGRLRGKLRSTSQIETVRSVGYCFVAC